MQDEVVPKVSVGPGDLDEAGKILAMAHPDTQQDMVAKSRRVGEALPRDLDEVAGIVAQDPYHDFVLGKCAVYLTDRAAGEETLEQIQRKRLVLDGDFGTWANREAPKVEKPFGGYVFGVRGPGPGTGVDTAGSGVPAAERMPEAAPMPLDEPQEPSLDAPEEAQEARGAVAGGGGPTEGVGKPLIPFLVEEEVLGPPDVLGVPPLASDPEPGSGAPGSLTQVATPELRSAVGGGLRSSLPSSRALRGGRRPLAVDVGGRVHAFEEPVGKGELIACGIVFLLGIGWGVFGGVVGQNLERRPVKPAACIAWERGELREEIERRREAHDRRLRVGGVSLGELESEERVIAGMVEVEEVLGGKRGQ